MKKTEVIKYISDRFEWFETMQEGLGHHSWHYTNRSSEDCINVKLYSWVDIDEVKKLLEPRTLRIANALDFDLDELCNDQVWGDFGMVQQAREDLESELKEKYSVSELEYGGRSGGWLCVVYKWDYIPDDFDNADYSYRELLSFKRIIDKADRENQAVNILVGNRKNELNRALKDPQNYTEQIEEAIADKKLILLEKAQELATI